MEKKNLSAEIAVVGAGPAGSTVAEVAALRGARVILIDRKREIGTPVQCGGFLPQMHELKELLPRAELPSTLEDIPKRYVLQHTTVQRIYAPSGGYKEFPVAGRVIDRRGFDRHLARLAARAGAQILTATRAHFEDRGLRLEGHISGLLQANVVVGADGPSSEVARKTNMWSRPEVGVCLEYEMVNVDIDPLATEMYFGTKWAPGGYAWIIPLGKDVANVGVGMIPSHLNKGTSLKQILKDFIQCHPTASNMLQKGETVAVMRGVVPAGGLNPTIQKNNVILVGDSAGQVMATSGGGIPLAMVGGKIAGEVATGYLRGECKLDEYTSRIKYAMGRELDNSVRIRGLVEKVMRNDKIMNALLSMLPPDQMKATQRGQVPEMLNKIEEFIARR